ncbi:MAG: MATE family efflux transporter [Lachnospiraceae bacterium]|nr:MATE family efflux transporter [Lachnospiraceae bacterium]
MENKNFYRNFFAIFIPLVLQNVITISVNLADNIMLGSYSETALAGAAAVNQVQFVYSQIVLAFGDALVILGSQYWGKKRIEPMKKLTSIGIRFELLVWILLFTATTFVPIKILEIFTTDGPIVAAGVEYLYVIKFTYLFFAITQLLLAMLRMTEVVKIALGLSIMTFFVNCGINYVLIFGHFGAPALGITGAAIGTLTARILETIVVILYIALVNNKLDLRLRDFATFDRLLAKDYIKVATPMVIVQGLWGLNTALQTVILGHMTAAAIAANSVASNLFMMVKSMIYGASATASVIIGRTIGEGDLKEVMKLSSRLQKMFVVMGILGGIILFIIRVPILNIYALSPETKAMANSFLIILCFVFVGMSYQMPTNNGIIRGGGSATYILKLDIISIWCIVLPLSFFMAFVVNASPLVVLICLNADQFFKGVPAFLMSHYGNWIKKLTR